MITLDTSGLLASIRATDRYHAACRAVIEGERGPRFISMGILSEVAWGLESLFPPSARFAFLDDVDAGAYRLDWHERDLDRIRALIKRYRDLPLGMSDAAVIACAERHGGRVLTTDYRHFSVVARGEKTMEVLPMPR